MDGGRQVEYKCLKKEIPGMGCSDAQYNFINE